MIDRVISRCRPSETEPRHGVYVQPAELDPRTREQFVLAEAARREVEQSARRGKVQLLVDRYALADLLTDLRDAVSRVWSESPDEQPKQRNTIRARLGDLAGLCERYGQ